VSPSKGDEHRPFHRLSRLAAGEFVRLRLANTFPELRRAYRVGGDRREPFRSRRIQAGTGGGLLMQTAGEARLETMSALTDADLVVRVRAGDGEAFATIMARYNQRLYRIARSIVGEDSAAEDVLQEAYLRSYLAMANFRGEAALGTWLARIVINEALMTRRQRRPSEDLDVLDRPGVSTDARVVAFPGIGQASPESAAARSEIRRLLEDAIDGLPPAFRIVFLLREIEDMSVEDTATQLALRPETVKTRLHRARRLMRHALDEKLADSLRDTFPFRGARCARMAASVLERLGLEAGPPPPSSH
jgi:RNA polymerase sigma-70 factor (ECF subfamily)